MNVRVKEGKMTGAVGSPPKNAMSQRVGGETQAKPIANAISQPKSRPQTHACAKNSNCGCY